MVSMSLPQTSPFSRSGRWAQGGPTTRRHRSRLAHPPAIQPAEGAFPATGFWRVIRCALEPFAPAWSIGPIGTQLAAYIPRAHSACSAKRQNTADRSATAIRNTPSPWRPHCHHLCLLLLQWYMPPTRTRARMKQETHGSGTAAVQASVLGVSPPSASKETIVSVSSSQATSEVSPTFQSPNAKTPARRVLRLHCPVCTDYPDGFRSEHELRRHTNRVHRKARKVWMTIDTSPDKTFLANCKACQTGKRYNECYNAASHLRRMHFHPHKRGERKMTAAEARRGGKPGDLDPPMDILKANWLREVDEVVGDDNELIGEDTESVSVSPPYLQPPPPPPPSCADAQPPLRLTPTIKPAEARAPQTPITPSTRSMAIDSIVDKMDAT